MEYSKREYVYMGITVLCVVLIVVLLGLAQHMDNTEKTTEIEKHTAMITNDYIAIRNLGKIANFKDDVWCISYIRECDNLKSDAFECREMLDAYGIHNEKYNATFLYEKGTNVMKTGAITRDAYEIAKGIRILDDANMMMGIEISEPR